MLDYVVENPAEGKLASQQGTLNLHQLRAQNTSWNSKRRAAVRRIGFKLQSGIKQTDLIHRAYAQIQKAGMTAVVANRLEDLGVDGKPRGYLVDQQGAHFVLQTSNDLNDAVQTLAERGTGLELAPLRWWWATERCRRENFR